MCRSGDGKGMFVQKFFRDFGSDFIVFEKIKNLFSKLGFVLFEDFRIVDKIVFIDQEEHPFFYDHFPFFVDTEGNHAFIFSDLDLYCIRIFA